MVNAGKVFVVTGAAGGIGRDFVLRLLEQKAVVWALDLSTAGLRALADEASRMGGELRTLTTDVTSESQIAAAIATVEARDKRIYCWVNNAGTAGLGAFDTLETKAFEKVLAVNLGGVVLGTRAALAHMEAHGGGTIINLGSVAGFVAAPYLSAYCASKHAVVGFTRALREELRIKCSNVRLVLVSPGFVDTQMMAENPNYSFPDWLKWMCSPPKVVSDALFSALADGRDEVIATWNGKLMHHLHAIFPRTTRRGADLLLSRSFRDWLLNRYSLG